MTDKKHFLRTPLNEGSPINKDRISTNDRLHLDREMAKHKADQEHDDAFHEANNTRHPRGATEKHHDIEYTRMGHKESSFHAVLQHHGYQKVASHSATSSRWSHPDLGGAITVNDNEPNHRVKSTISSHGRTPGELHRRLTDIARAPALSGAHHVHEEVELDEVSKKYLGKYIKAASDDMNDHAFTAGHASAERDHKSSLPADKKAQKRLIGIHKATDKLTKEELELEEGKTLRATGDYKRDNLTKAIKRYSADKRKTVDSKRKIQEGARIDEFFGFLRSKDSKPLPVHQRVEPTFGAKPKPKAAAAPKKVSSKPLPISQRKEPNLHGITPVSKTAEHKPAPVVAKAAPAKAAPAKPKSTRNTLANRLANVKAWKKPEKKTATKTPAAPVPAKTEPTKSSSPLKPVAIGSVVKSKKTVKEEMAPATIIKDKKFRAALKKAMAAGLIQPDRSNQDTTSGNTDEYTP